MLTRNESADLVERIVGHLVARSPDSTGGIRMFGVDSFLDATSDIDMHKDHRDWLIERLSKSSVLDDIDKFAVNMRAAGSTLAVPWRD